ncbi:hypothetical protein OG233_03280 [Streptomyces sp. NBC_01218]|uniref:hypothetical protein n=1 Tax=unclassified Streptomyces TaxID=2593676 RepID=UPI0023B98C2E|nr:MULTISPECIES: hypothetical protein [unclassified Streptomyces]WEH43938.1 hypothetical protein PZB77_03325 [Streptomyces sp. AM 2-1-1]WSQ50272.1 hypothetical protein OG233_03280 [Streptomyces sp. NBC_01218]
MPPKPPDAAAARPLPVVNADIRALMRAHRGRLSVEGRREYERLLAEWAAAVRGDGAEAA